MADANLTIGVKTDPAKLDDLLSGFTKAAKEADSSAASLGSTLGKIGATLGGVAALKGAFDFILDATRTTEDLTTQFIAFTGSAKGASDQLERLQQFAAQSPFSLEEVATANRTLLAFGSTTKQSIEQLRQLGEVSAATGTDLSELSTIFGQIQAAGKLTGERFNQLVERGVNIGPELAKSLGVAESSLEKLRSEGKISADEVAKAFQKMTAEGGQFFGSTERLSKTVSGSLSTLKDNITALASAIGSQGVPAFTGYINSLSDVTNAVTDFINERAKIAAETGEEKRLRALKEELKGLEDVFNNLNTESGSIKRTLTSLLFTGGEKGLDQERDRLKEKIKATNAEINTIIEQASKDREKAAAEADATEQKRIADKKSGDAAAKLREQQKIEDDLLIKASEEKQKKVKESEAKITEIAFQEAAVRQQILAEQDVLGNEQKLIALQEREAELTAARLAAEATRYELLGQYDSAEILRAQDKQNKLIAIQTSAEQKKLADLKKANADKNALDIAAAEANQKFLESSYQRRVDTSRVGLAAIAGLQKSGNREAFIIGKRAAQAQVLLDTPKAAFAAYSSVVGIPVVGPALAALAVAGVLAQSASNVRQIEAQSMPAFAEGGVVPGVGNKDTVPALLTPGEVVIPQKNFEDIQGNLGTGGDQIMLLQQGNAISARILDVLTFGTVSEKLTTQIAILNEIVTGLDKVALAASSRLTPDNVAPVIAEIEQNRPSGYGEQKVNGGKNVGNDRTPKQTR